MIKKFKKFFIKHTTLALVGVIFGKLLTTKKFEKQIDMVADGTDEWLDKKFPKRSEGLQRQIIKAGDRVWARFKKRLMSDWKNKK